MICGTFGSTHAAADPDGESYNEGGWLAGVGAVYMLSDHVAMRWRIARVVGWAGAARRR